MELKGKQIISCFAGNPLETPQGPLEVPGPLFENHCSTTEIVLIL